ncbi:TPA: fimbrial protein [Stenotrophomonas maltophilia]|jgi:type 1 fimbria pilin|uniref:fimbrial protein n=1 Tax=Stenotrophomonas TaxID=40323 RepID=UPI0013130AC0|nr:MULTISPECIES: fimbrial protein [Stenotrophomonas]ELF4108399.1 fimbrial protein [Stenotrophomonas maltophilia]MBO1742881.1 fimbrial protein [Stenotrophomonas maltophilia]MCU1174437.1 fimbrial protein [Stenotrophomonas maltophilia]WAP02557.1 fimbrial protein [Stenotrophomonas sp. SBJS02]HEA4094036.1 fimbrial protein [Stenotrophomonas maltophilia]
MSRSPLQLVAVSLLCLLASAAHAQATLTISGHVLPGTCTLAAPAITLDPVKADEMTPGAANRVKAGALNFTGCVGVSRARLSFDGTAADGDPERWKNTAATTPATGVTVALLAGATGNTYLKKGDADIPVAVSGATASYPLRAGYFIPNTSGINAGNISTEIVVTAAYD